MWLLAVIAILAFFPLLPWPSGGTPGRTSRSAGAGCKNPRGRYARSHEDVQPAQRAAALRRGVPRRGPARPDAARVRRPALPGGPGHRARRARDHAREHGTVFQLRFHASCTGRATAASRTPSSRFPSTRASTRRRTRRAATSCARRTSPTTNSRSTRGRAMRSRWRSRSRSCACPTARAFARCAART
jgi:hypothetical protein